jgi:hypothetical protein
MMYFHKPHKHGNQLLIYCHVALRPLNLTVEVTNFIIKHLEKKAREVAK